MDQAQDKLKEAIERQIGGLVLTILQKDEIIRQLTVKLAELEQPKIPVAEEPK